MVELRTFEGDAEEMAEFTTGVWRQSYQGKMPLPLWTPDFLEWELWTEGEDSRDFMIAAYDRDKLVGLLAGRPQRFRHREGSALGTLGSYLSVHPDYRRQGIAEALHQEQKRKHLERGADFQLGFVYLGARVAKGRKFWFKQTDGAVIVRKVGLWARMLDHRAVAEFEFSPSSALAARAMALVQRRPATLRDQRIREFRSDDLPDCLALVRRLTEAVQLGYEWDETTLSRQLLYRGVPSTLVLERDGRAAGMVNYCRLDFLGRRRIRSGVVDIAAFGELDATDRLRLMQATLADMSRQGLQVALMLRLPLFPSGTLLRAGFVAQPKGYYVIGLAMKKGIALSGARRLLIHWR